MQVISSRDALKNAPPGLHYAMGNFDGFHLGHQALLAGLEQPRGLITFEPHPRRFFAPDAPAFRLMSADDKRRHAASLGMTTYVELPFDAELAAMSPDAFHREVLAPLAPGGLVVGKDFCYGKDRQGDIASLAAACRDLQCSFAPFDLVQDQHATPVGSSAIRAAIRAGDFAAARTMLGRPWCIRSQVYQGDQLGRTIGFPTANLRLESYLRPPVGIFATLVQIGDNPKLYGGAAYHGYRPTLACNEERFEVHLLDFDGDLYGQQLEVQMLGYVRGDKKLDGMQALKAQIAADCAAVRQALTETAL